MSAQQPAVSRPADAPTADAAWCREREREALLSVENIKANPHEPGDEQWTQSKIEHFTASAARYARLAALAEGQPVTDATERDAARWRAVRRFLRVAYCQMEPRLWSITLDGFPVLEFATPHISVKPTLDEAADAMIALAALRAAPPPADPTGGGARGAEQQGHQGE